MNRDLVELAIEEAERFIKRAEAYLKESAKVTVINDFEYHSSAPKESASCKRSSMDLSRALSDMRNKD